MKKAKTVVITKEAEMQKMASELRIQKTLLETQENHVKSLKDKLTHYMDETGQKTFEGWALVERIGGVKWEGAAGKKLEQIQTWIMGEIDATYLETKINAQKLYNALTFDKAIPRILNEYDVKLVQSLPSVFLKDNAK